MKKYAVIDTNVIVSGLISKHTDSATVKILEYALSGIIIPIINKEIISEYQTVLHRDKFRIPAQYADSIISRICDTGIVVKRMQCSNFEFPDKNDAVFYEVAISHGNSYLITGNLKHFPRTDRVVSPSEMIGIIESGTRIIR